MKKIKFTAIILVTVFLLSSLLSLSISAEKEDYSELIAQKEAYLEERGDYYRGEYGWLEPYFDATQLTVLLYTDVAKEWSFKKYESEHGDFENPVVGLYAMFTDQNYFYLSSPDIEKAIPTTDTVNYRTSQLRQCIKYFGITKEQLKEANRKMQEEPNSIRELFPFLTDGEFEDAKMKYGLFSGLFCEPLADFMIEALYLEDDETANNLLCEPNSVYLKDIDYAINTGWLMDGGRFSKKDILAADLTSEWVGRFLEYESNKEDPDPENYTDEIIAAREEQLRQVQAGENTAAFVGCAVISLSLTAGVVVARRKKKYD